MPNSALKNGSTDDDGIDRLLDAQEHKKRCTKCNSNMVDMGIETTRTMEMSSFRRTMKWLCPSCHLEKEEVLY
jgi:uncharacterized protein with PIN domain